MLNLTPSWLTAAKTRDCRRLYIESRRCNMAETKDQVQVDDSILFKTIASGCFSEIHELLRLCDHKTPNFSSHACNIGHAHLLQFLHQDGARLELRDDNGNTPLLICSKENFPGIVGQLLSMGADVNAKNNLGDTALMLATSREVIELLLEDRRLHLDEQNSTGNTALMSAIETSHLQKVKLLINAGADPKRNASLVNSSNESAFDVAKRRGFGKLLEWLYRAKESNSNPLQLAVGENDFESCATLLRFNLCNKEESLSLRPDMLCYVLKQIQQRETTLRSDVDFVLELCRLGMDVNRCQCCTKSRMELVLNIGSCELAEILCAHGAEVTHDDLVSAVKAQHIEMIPLLIKHGAGVKKYESPRDFVYKGSALDVALENSLTNVASILLNHRAALHPEYAVTQALLSNNIKVLKFLLTECAEATKAVVKNPETFIRAVKSGSLQNIQLLLDKKVDINRVHLSRTPLMNAIHTKVINYLIRKGASVNLKTSTTALINVFSSKYCFDVYSAFHKSCKMREQQILRVITTLLKNGATLDDKDELGSTALIASVCSNLSVKVLKYLLYKGANVNQRNNDGHSALHRAAANSKRDFVEVLLKHGARVNVKNFFGGRTPLHLAVGNLHSVKLLLKKQANFNAEDDSGNTPLSLAAERGGDNDDIVDVLISNGSNVNHRNNNGMTPLWLAARKLNTKCVSLFMDANAVDCDHQQQTSALSLVLNKWFPGLQSQRTATLLIKRRASTDFVRRDIIHRLIAAGNDGILIQELIKTGFCPTEIDLKTTILSWPESSVSPLAVSLMLDSLDFTRYFIENGYLTKADVRLVSRSETILNYLEERNAKTLPYLNEVSQQPMKLEQLCLITISSAFGSDRGRRERILKSELSVPLQEKLLFENLERKVLEPVREGSRCLQQMTKHQVGKEERWSAFYELDDDFFERTSSSESSSASDGNEDL
ncbi:ankyrin repeat and KH domain-containing protein 1 [Biomphalaria glabrata]